MPTKNLLHRKLTLLAILIVTTFLLTGATGCPLIDGDDDRSDPPAGQNISFESESQADRKLQLRQGAAAFFQNLPQDDYLITAQGLKELMDNKPGLVQVVDIRDPKKFAQGHIQGAENIPFEEIGARMGRLNEGNQIIVVCETGQASGMTIAALNIANFQAKSLRDGFPAWQKAGFATATGRADQQRQMNQPNNR